MLCYTNSRRKAAASDSAIVTTETPCQPSIGIKTHNPVIVASDFSVQRQAVQYVAGAGSELL